MSANLLDTIDHVLEDHGTSPDAMRWMPEPEDSVRREQLWDTYGRPVMVKAAHALWVLGLSSEVHPHDVAAFAYSSREACAAYEAANLEYYGHPTLGRFTDARGVVSVLDLRPALRRSDVTPRTPVPAHSLGPAYRRRSLARKRRNRR